MRIVLMLKLYVVEINVYNLFELLNCFSEVVHNFMVLQSVLTIHLTCHEDMASLGGGNSVARQ